MGAITGNIDVAQVVLYVFWFFFAGLIYYLRREDRREGYPLFSEPSNTYKDQGLLFIPPPKTFKLAHGGEVLAPNGKPDDRTHNMKKVEPWPGAPFEPVGDPMTAAVGPGSYAQRADVPDQMLDGSPRLRPLRAAPGFALSARDPDARGLPVIGADGVVAGTISDVWVDRMEVIVRYLEVELAEGEADGAKPRVLLPINFARINAYRRHVEVHALQARHFASVPKLADADQVTLLEEDKITAYYGAGTLYADPRRAEPWL